MIRILGERIDALSARERLMLLGALLVVLYSLWDYTLVRPLEARRQALRADIGNETAQLPVLEQQLDLLTGQLAQDPNREARNELARLDTTLRELDRQLQAATADLIPPALMVRVLEDLLLSRGGLNLIGARSLPPVPFLVPQGPEGTDQEGGERPPAPPIYRHGLVLEFQGSYLDVLDYLRAVEGLPWRLFWDRLEFQVEDYPRARVSITVHTLSLEEGWIGV